MYLTSVWNDFTWYLKSVYHFVPHVGVSQCILSQCTALYPRSSVKQVNMELKPVNDCASYVSVPLCTSSQNNFVFQVIPKVSVPLCTSGQCTTDQYKTVYLRPMYYYVSEVTILPFTRGRRA